MISVQLPPQIWRSDGQTRTFVNVGIERGDSVPLTVPAWVSMGISVWSGVGFSTGRDDAGSGAADVCCVTVGAAGEKMLRVPVACRKYSEARIMTMAITAMAGIRYLLCRPGGAAVGTRPTGGTVAARGPSAKGASGLPQDVQNLTVSSFLFPHWGHIRVIFCRRIGFSVRCY